MEFMSRQELMFSLRVDRPKRKAISSRSSI